MRLLKSRVAAEEDLIALQTEGYRLLDWLRRDYHSKRDIGKFDEDRDVPRYREALHKWADGVIRGLNAVFPTELEAHIFMNPPASPLRRIGVNAKWSALDIELEGLIRELGQIRLEHLRTYTDLPIKDRLFVEDIDSFHQVRDVNPAMVADLLGDGGYLDLAEDTIQRALEEIIEEPFHKKDWGGEYNDLYTSNLMVNGARRATAFLLKGNGLKRPKLEIRDCGHNGDQLVRLFESPAELFVVQFVGTVSEAVIRDVEGKVSERRRQGEPAWGCIMNGQDTARVLRAYGKL